MFQNCCSRTRVTKLKAAPNMADAISIKDSDSRLKSQFEVELVKYFKLSSNLTFGSPIRLPLKESNLCPLTKFLFLWKTPLGRFFSELMFSNGGKLKNKPLLMFLRLFFLLSSLIVFWKHLLNVRNAFLWSRCINLYGESLSHSLVFKHILIIK